MWHLAVLFPALALLINRRLVNRLAALVLLLLFVLLEILVIPLALRWGFGAVSLLPFFLPLYLAYLCWWLYTSLADQPSGSS